jgi:hypothetical protein
VDGADEIRGCLGVVDRWWAGSEGRLALEKEEAVRQPKAAMDHSQTTVEHVTTPTWGHA